jgi:hypothetical protein
VDHRRLAAARRAPTARPITNLRFTGRRGTGAVAWVRLDRRNLAIAPAPAPARN